MDNKYNVILHTHYEPVGTPAVQPFEYYPNCTNVENDGAILCFTDAAGDWRKTSAPWTITKVNPEPTKQILGDFRIYDQP